MAPKDPVRKQTSGFLFRRSHSLSWFLFFRLIFGLYLTSCIHSFSRLISHSGTWPLSVEVLISCDVVILNMGTLEPCIYNTFNILIKNPDSLHFSRQMHVTPGSTGHITLPQMSMSCFIWQRKLFFFFFHTDGNEGSPQSSLCGARTLKWDYRGLGQTEGHHSLTKLVPPLRLPPLKLIQPASQLNLRKKIPSGCQTPGGLSDTNQKCSRRLKDNRNNEPQISLR